MKMNNEISKYRVEQAEKLFNSLENLKDLQNLYLQSLGITLKEWINFYMDELELSGIRRGTGSIEEQPLYVINDIIGGVNRLIENRALEGFRLIMSELQESTKENSSLKKEIDDLLKKELKEKEVLKDLIVELKSLTITLKDLIPKEKVEKEEEKKVEDDE